MIQITSEKAREALISGQTKKNYVISVYSASDTSLVEYTIDNSNLVKESVKFTERMCSESTLKFGLCEGSSVEFQYFSTENNALPNIKGRRVSIILKVQYFEDETENWYSIPMGFYDVESTARQASTGIIKAQCYNKLQSEYLDAKVNDQIAELQEDTVTAGKISVYSVLSNLLNDYGIQEPRIKRQLPSQEDDYSHTESKLTFKLNGKTTSYYPTIESNHYSLEVSNGRIKFDIESYLTKLENAMADLKQTLSDSIQNFDTFWNSYKATESFMQFGIAIYNDNDKLATYTLETMSWSGASICRLAQKLSYLTNALVVDIYLPISFEYSTTATGTKTTLWQGSEALTQWDAIIETYNYKLSNLANTLIPLTDLPDVTLRDLQSAVYESLCQFGRLDRSTDLFSGRELGQETLFPSDELYPSDTLYPASTTERGTASMYSKLWADEGNIHTFKDLIITYKCLDDEGNETEKTLQRQVNADGTDNYNMSDNWLFKNLVWTSDEVGTYADAMVEKMKDLSWFPFEMWCTGMPHIETGDEIEINFGGTVYTSYVLSRNLNGIQDLQDTLENGELNIF